MPKIKIAPHLLNNGNADATQWIYGKPSVVKLVDTGIPNEFIDDSTILWIGRKTEQEFDPNNPNGSGFSSDAVLAARQYINRYLDAVIRANPKIQAWELNNEPVIENPATMSWFATFLTEGIRILRMDYNKTAVVGNWSVGCPRWELGLWKYYTPVLNAIRVYKGILGRHSYGPLDVWYALRHRKDNEEFTNLGFPNLPVVITECGAENLPTVNWKPWKQQFKNANDYFQYLAEYDQLLKQDSYVYGATVFTYGQGWDEWNMNDSGIGQLVRNYANGQADFTIGNEPEPLPQYLSILPMFRNLRTYPNGDLYAAAYGNTNWKIVEKKGDWYKIQSTQDLWVHKSGIKLK